MSDIEKELQDFLKKAILKKSRFFAIKSNLRHCKKNGIMGFAKGSGLFGSQ
ncbi:MAG: hypothetical protein IKO10_10465 [Lachnospiraceae bacterium]|nr:hypothetical protein [Lachnospiraceae bacterium]